MKTLEEYERTPEFWERVKLGGYTALKNLMKYNGKRGATRVIHFLKVSKICSQIANATGVLDPNRAEALGLLHDFGRFMPDTLKYRSHEVIGYKLFETLGLPEIARGCMTHAIDSEYLQTEKSMSVTIKNEYDMHVAKDYFEKHGDRFDDYEVIANIVDSGYGDFEQARSIAEKKKFMIKLYGEKNTGAEKFERVIDRQREFEEKYGIKIDDVIDTTKVLTDEDLELISEHVMEGEKGAHDMADKEPSISLDELKEIFNDSMTRPIDKLRAAAPTYESLMHDSIKYACPMLEDKLS